MSQCPSISIIKTRCRFQAGHTGMHMSKEGRTQKTNGYAWSDHQQKAETNGSGPEGSEETQDG